MEYRPREKLRKRGITSLSSSELLQLLIGSGNARMGVSKIARKAHRVLEKNGSNVTYDQLSAVPGLGPARISQILASFELAGRYPTSLRLIPVDSTAKVLTIFSPLRHSLESQILYLTLDGALREITRRFVFVPQTSPALVLRQIFSDVVRDNASRFIIGIGSRHHLLEPSLFDLTLVRDLRTVADFLNVSFQSAYLVNQKSERILKVAI